MKPPWKYLAQLMSRQRSPDTADEKSAPEDLVAVPASIEGEIDAKTPVLQPEPPKAEVTEEPEQSNSDPQGQGSAGEAAAKLPKLRQTRLKTAKKGRGGSVFEIAVNTSNVPVPATSSPPGSLSDEATCLDKDIKQLRDLLAQKLRMQNAQLRKMLERFERS